MSSHTSSDAAITVVGCPSAAISTIKSPQGKALREIAALSNGDLAGLPEDALDTAFGLYLADPTAWT